MAKAKLTMPPDQPAPPKLTADDLAFLVPMLLTGAAFAARLTKNTKDDEIVKRLQEAFGDGSLVRALAKVLGIK